MGDLPNSRNRNTGSIRDLGPSALVSSEPGAKPFGGPHGLVHEPIIHIRLEKTSRIWIPGAGKIFRMEITGLRRVLAENVKSRRKEQFGWSQTELAKRAGTVQSHISRLERMESGVTVDVVAGCAHAFGCHAWELLIDRGAYGRILSPEAPPPPPRRPEPSGKRAVHKRKSKIAR